MRRSLPLASAAAVAAARRVVWTTAAAGAPVDVVGVAVRQHQGAAAAAVSACRERQRRGQWGRGVQASLDSGWQDAWGQRLGSGGHLHARLARQPAAGLAPLGQATACNTAWSSTGATTTTATAFSPLAGGFGDLGTGLPWLAGGAPGCPVGLAPSPYRTYLAARTMSSQASAAAETPKDHVPNPPPKGDDDDDDGKGKGDTPSASESKEKLVVFESSAWPESKVEQTVKAMIKKQLEDDQLHFADLKHPSDAQQVETPEETKSPVVVRVGRYVRRMGTQQYWVGAWEGLKHELKHYAAGFRLLYTDITVCFRLVRKTLKGEVLSRRERAQLVRTVSDLFRLVPFLVFIIVPGLEILLPFAVKIFPGLLPSTFADAKTKEDRIKAELKIKLETAKFFQQTIEDMAATNKTKAESQRASQLAAFLENSRTTGQVTTAEIKQVATFFPDDITLDTLSRPQLQALCRHLSLNQHGSNSFLRWQLRAKLRSIKADDTLIQRDGVQSLSLRELEQACRERGIRAVSITEEGLRSRLQNWVDLHLVEKVPSVLLLLSLVMKLGTAPEMSRLKAAIDALPDELKEVVTVRLKETDGADVDLQSRLQVIVAEEAKIKADKLQEQRLREQEGKMLELEHQMALAAERAKIEEKPMSLQPDDGLGKQPSLSTRKEIADEPVDDQKPITLEELVDIAVAVVASSGDSTRSDLTALKREVEDHNSDLEQLQTVSGGVYAAPQGAARLSKRVKSMIKRVEGGLEQLERPAEGNLHPKILDLDDDGFVSVDELIHAMKQVKNPPSEAKLRSIAEVLDTDADGILSLDVIKQVFALVQSEGQAVKTQDLSMLVSLVEKEAKIVSSSEASSASAGKQPTQQS
eukprot:m.92942 g.92942  ORF g.92942 m.92942 type:complete len:866 (-) comp15080_c1_seq2:76-2673(-)